MPLLGKSGLNLFLSNLKTFLNNNFAAKSHTHSAATTSANGLMSKTDKAKLDGIAIGANKYTHPSHTAKNSGLYKVTVDAQGHVSAATAATKEDITALGIPSTNTTYAAMKGATTSAAGATGLVPAPATGAANRYLRSDGTWQVPPNTTYAAMKGATADAAGTAGLAPVPAKGAANRYLRSDGTWQIPPNTIYGNMKAATASAAGGAGLVPAPAAGKQASFLRGDGTWAVPTNTTYSNMKAATASAAGGAGLVPAPAAGKQTSFLRGDGTWAVPTNTTYSVATTTKNGLMSAADKVKLDKIAYILGIDDTGVYVESV